MKLSLLPRCLLLWGTLLVLPLSVPSEAAAAPKLGGAIVTHGSGTSTLTDLTANPDGTLSIVAYQEGYLHGIGAFAGSFAYTAYIDYNTGITQLVGSGSLVTAGGDELRLSIWILQVGLDYPFVFTGELTVEGGTGRFAGARGLLQIAGLDEESFTDNFQLAGVILTSPKARKKR